MQSRLPKLRQLSGEILTFANESEVSRSAVSLLQSEPFTSVSYAGIRYSLQQAAVVPNQVHGGVRLDKLKTVAKCVPVADGGADAHIPDTQPDVQVHDLPNGQFNRQRGREAAFTYLKRSARNGTH